MLSVFTPKRAGHVYHHRPAGCDEVDAHERAKWKLISFLKRGVRRRSE